MNHSVTSKEEILSCCKNIVKEEGIHEINIRKVASSLDIAVGSLYNYFPNKRVLLQETIVSVWCDIFDLEPLVAPVNFIDEVNHIYQSSSKGIVEYGNFFTGHFLGLNAKEKETSKALMEQTLYKIHAYLETAYDMDPNIHLDEDGPITKDDVLNLCFQSLLSNLVFATNMKSPLIPALESILHKK